MSDETKKSESEEWRYRARQFGNGNALAVIVGIGDHQKTVHISRHALGLDSDQVKYLALALDDVFKAVHHATRTMGG